MSILIFPRNDKSLYYMINLSFLTTGIVAINSSQYKLSRSEKNKIRYKTEQRMQYYKISRKY